MKITQLCPTLCESMDCSLPVSSVHGILQARILKWVAVPFSSRSSWPKNQTGVFYIAGRFFTNWATRKAHGRKQRRTKEPLNVGEREAWKSWLKARHSENEDHGIWSHPFMGNRWGDSGNSVRLFGAPNSLQMVTAATKLKDAYSLEGKLWPT